MADAILNTNLIDTLVPVVDSLRSTLHTVMGDRQWRVFLVHRKWSDDEIGEGIATITSSVELVPVPSITPRGLRNEMRPAGTEEEGDVLLTEISFTMAEGELYKPTLARGEEFYYRVVDGQGQNIRTRFFVPSRPPFPDRVQDIGWQVQLRRVEIQEPV